MGPVFIGGLDRSGKTTLRAFLTSHPKLAIAAVGSNMWTYFYQRYGDLRKRPNLDRCLQAMLRYKHVRYLNPDVESIVRRFLDGEQSYARLFALFQQDYARQIGKPRWGDQTGLVERYAAEILGAYPTAKMLHMIRDPRDRYEASLELWPKGKGRVGGATARWLYSVALAKRNKRRYPCSYKIVQFEALVNQTETTLREVCDFLGERFEPDMLKMTGAPAFRAGLVGESEPSSRPVCLSPEFIGRFRGRIGSAEIVFMQLQAGREMSEFGYELEVVRMSSRDWISFWIRDLPLNVLRKTAWRTLEVGQQKLPQFIPRRIDPRKLTEDVGAMS